MKDNLVTTLNDGVRVLPSMVECGVGMVTGAAETRSYSTSRFLNMKANINDNLLQQRFFNPVNVYFIILINNLTS
ncbi:MAG: hypothetical protein QM731_06680 [Chitinophagaceae bacterium]